MSSFVKRPSTQARAVGLITDLLREKKLRLSDKTTPDKILSSVQEILRDTDNPILKFGKRTESMFAFVVAALGHCAAIRDEDAGTLYARSESIVVPDYRVVLDSGGEFLIEVKNHHGVTRPLRLTAAYVDGLKAYGKAFHRPIKIAVYWSSWSIWTLVPLGAIRKSRSSRTMTLPQAMLANEMSLLGDHLLATRAPLMIRLTPDENTPVRIEPGQEVLKFKIGRAEAYCGSQRLDEKIERQIAFYFMLFGGWPQKTRIQTDNGYLASIDYVAAPMEQSLGQDFDIVGSASTMMSRHFGHLTVSAEGEVDLIQPHIDPSKIGLHIPRDYSGSSLPLWRFVMQPNRRGARKSSKG